MTFPFLQSARTATSPAGVSSTNSVTGSFIESMPVSSRTVVVQMVLVPDIGGYSTCSMMMNPASALGCVGARIRLQFAAG